MPVLQAKNLKLSYTSGSVSCLLAEIKWKQWTESGTGRKNLKERDRQKEVETWVYRQWEKDKVREHRKWLGHTIQCCCWVPCLLCALAQCPFVNLRKLGTALQIYIFFATLFTPSRSYLILEERGQGHQQRGRWSVTGHENPADFQTGRTVHNQVLRVTED